jgi:exopolysaccharide biosynthesis polyprenyl glycosylphosphotransferase
VLDDAPGFMGRALVAGAFATTFKVLTNDPVGDRLIYAALLFVVIALPLRAVANVAVRRLRRTGYISHATLIIGAGQVGSHLASLLLEHREYGLRPVGFLNRDRLVRPDAPIPMLGRVDELSRVLVEHRIRNVVVAFGAAPESGLIDILRTCDRLRCEIFLVPRLYELHAVNRDMELVWGFPLARLRRAPFRTLTWRLKRVFDIVLAGLAFVALLPVLAICAVLVRLDGGPGVIFRQERVGLDGRAFQVLKFRTLRPASEAESASTWSVSDDARLRPVGRALRRTSLDELPQLWNVLRGDMSLVGPRPERPFFVNVFTEQFPRYMARHRVPAGLTGWAQVHGLRGDTSIADRARFDNYYIENWSMWEDVKILLRTVGQVARAAGR